MALGFTGIFKKDNSFIGIDIGSSTIKVVQARKEKGFVVLENYGSILLGSYVKNGYPGKSVSASTEEVNTALSVLFESMKIQTKRCGVELPFHASLISLIELPMFSDQKLAQMIPFEAQKYIPLPLEDVHLSWQILPNELLQPAKPALFEELSDTPQEPPKPKRYAQLLAFHKSSLRRYKEIMMRTGLEVEFFENEIYGTQRAVLYDPRSPVMVVDIGARTTKFYILESAVVHASSFINQGGQTMTDAIVNSEDISFTEAETKKIQFGFEIEDKNILHALDLVIDDIFSEINNRVVDFESKQKKTVGKIIFTGGGASMRGFLERARQKVTIQTEKANPFARLQHDAVLSRALQERGPEFSMAIGAVLRGFSL